MLFWECLILVESFFGIQLRTLNGHVVKHKKAPFSFCVTQSTLRHYTIGISNDPISICYNLNQFVPTHHLLLNQPYIFTKTNPLQSKLTA